jgi:hypothetical protein
MTPPNKPQLTPGIILPTKRKRTGLKTMTYILLSVFSTLCACTKEDLIFDPAPVGFRSISKMEGSREVQSLPPYRGIYIDQFNTIVGNITKENELLSWCKYNNMNSISLYDLTTVLSNSANIPKLAAFIKKARLSYGITSVGAVRGSGSEFSGSTCSYNSGRTDTLERFNVFNLELEWWNNVCTFPQYTDHMKTMTASAHSSSPGIISEEYIGWLSNPAGQESAQANALVANSDRIMVHDYRIGPDAAYTLSRLDQIGQAAKAQGKKFKVIILFSVEQEFMFSYFQKYSFAQAYADYVNQYNTKSFAGKSNIDLIGYQIFDQSLARLARPLIINTTMDAEIITVD